jgi:hypothetical protein
MASILILILKFTAMLEESFGLLIYLKKPKNYVEGPLPLYLRITVDGNVKELSLNRSWEKNRWNPYSSRAVGNKEDARELNLFLDAIEVSVYQAKRQILESGQQITAVDLMDNVSGRKQRDKMLIKIFEEHNEKMKSLIGKDYAKGTYTRFETALKHTKSFIKWKYNKDDINIFALNNEFVNDLSLWFKTVRRCGHNTTIKYITNLKKVILICVNNGWLIKDPFSSFDLSLEKNDPVFLSKEEIQCIIEKEINNARLQSVRDIFVFCCFTGLAFIDVKKLKRSEVCRYRWGAVDFKEPAEV